MGDEGGPALRRSEAFLAAFEGVRLESLLAQGPGAVVVDLSAVDRLSSSDVTSLLRIGRRCRDRGVVLQVRCPSRRSFRTLRRSGVYTVLGPSAGATTPDSRAWVRATSSSPHGS